ncbi:TraR/DksA C4-type zinc finger protein [Thiohalobacter sp. IOR34]|uniref:TraR/DksA family transcriptional regulator n=1 Tax=Thiohalobacter sp. IOR34 TaxID=3057176 RepID=UPI0025B08D61|nr:TraR/DksA C4-type zinc finger protein [Thiohalobacter sp. IOR34]WJW75108.1 TraR/DksA C4-type zinc finger protein [Thiohalobacter sp. IOR34]
MLSPEQIRHFESILNQRYAELREAIRQALLESDDQRFIELAGQVHDLEELSVADLLVDLNYARIDQLLAELRDVEDALRRIREGTYGLCIDTGEPIELDRLEANPTAKRTARAQALYEKTHAGHSAPSL